jgi:hypothetical protein
MFVGKYNLLEKVIQKCKCTYRYLSTFVSISKILFEIKLFC